VVRADRVLRAVPPRFLGANLTSYGKTGSSVADWEPCCLGPAESLPQPIALWRTPGGILGDFFHLNGLYDNGNLDGTPNGVDLLHFVKVAERLRGGLLHVLNVNASDQELSNEIEYLNSPAPERAGKGWTDRSFRFDAAAPEGYFAWLRAKHGHVKPVGVRYVEIGNEIWNHFNDTDNRCNHEARCYGVQAAALSAKLKAKDPALRIGVSILTVGQSANPRYRAPSIYAGFKSKGAIPDFVFDHGYYRCNQKPAPHLPEGPAVAGASILWADGLAISTSTTQAELREAFGARANGIEIFLDEFGPQACDDPDAWEGFGPWQTAATAHVYAAALHAGISHVSYYSWNGDPQDPDAAGYGLVNGKSAVDANYWGLWFAARFLAGATGEVEVRGIPAKIRAYAVRSANAVKVLLLNADATATISLAVEGGTEASYFRMDQSYAAKGVPAKRRSVPQIPPKAAPADLSALRLPPLSTTLVEVKLKAAAPPEPGAPAPRR
jgi:hypothetical protein